YTQSPLSLVFIPSGIILLSLSWFLEITTGLWVLFVLAGLSLLITGLAMVWYTASRDPDIYHLTHEGIFHSDSKRTILSVKKENIKDFNVYKSASSGKILEIAVLSDKGIVPITLDLTGFVISDQVDHFLVKLHDHFHQSYWEHETCKRVPFPR
ncbi:MAG: hypothetical protein ACXAE3_11685, partial [Candidatus Kariarchaeaceae archaeon]